MKIAAARLNPVIGDIEGNAGTIRNLISEAGESGAMLVVFPELAVSGYPPMDLILDRYFIDKNLKAIRDIAASATGIDVICGFIDRDESGRLFNSAAFIRNGCIESVSHKALLPAYDVFDEPRYFTPGDSFELIQWNGRKIGLTVCEDIWNAVSASEEFSLENPGYSVNPVEELSRLGADLIINISASPYSRGKNRYKLDMICGICRKYNLSLLYVNQVGGNDTLVFDGDCYYMDMEGTLRGYAETFREGITVFDEDTPALTISHNDTRDTFSALVLGLRDYARKCGFTKAVLGLSGGIDSALTAVIAVHALGPVNVTGITMPSIYSSGGSVVDSQKLARNLGIIIRTVPITVLFDTYMKELRILAGDHDTALAEENIQARIRGNILMGISNMERSLLLSTGNKSELATGYCTLYGDMSGGLAVISDVPKTLVYELAEYINRESEIIPHEIIEKAPSAELKPEQKDQDTLPPYDILDVILELYLERGMKESEITGCGFDRSIVSRVLRMVDSSEYKRRQAAPGLKVTAKAFGSGRRIPIARKID